MTRRIKTAIRLTAMLLAASAAAALADDDVFDRVEHHFADSGGVKIHYVTLGEGAPLLFVHGFPDWWYTWREQMAVLASDFKCVAMDLRGYNQSDQPRGIENYGMSLLLGDVSAVIADLGVERVTLVGHDWGGAIAWRYAMTHPERVERLVILNLTHPRGYAAVVASPTEAQKQNTQYARNFAASQPDDSKSATVFARIGAGGSEAVAQRYQEAMARSYYDGMVNYYRANYGQVAQSGTSSPPDIPNVQCPVLQFHGLKDTAVDKDGLAKTWDWIDRDYTLVTLPDVGHWVQRDGADVVSTTMKWWLLSRQ